MLIPFAQITIDVSWGGICVSPTSEDLIHAPRTPTDLSQQGTDLHEWVNGPNTINKPEKPHGITGDHMPVSFGHEFTGRVSALPANYPSDGRFKMGMPIMVDPRIICRKCSACTSGMDNICPNWVSSNRQSTRVLKRWLIYPLVF